MLEWNVGHPDTDVAGRLPEEGIGFCGNIFLNGSLPLPGEEDVTQNIVNDNPNEALVADIYVVGSMAD